MKLLIMHFSPASCYFLSLGLNAVFSSASCSQTPPEYVLPTGREIKPHPYTGNGLQIWRVAANMLNKQSDSQQGVVFQLGVGWGPTACYEMLKYVTYNIASSNIL
jgi:hypothetical protein